MITPYETPNGKGIKLVPHANKMMFDIAFVGGGEVPPAIQGSFNSTPMAYKAIESYLATQTFRKPKQDAIIETAATVPKPKQVKTAANKNAKAKKRRTA